jgi:AraC family transcriptional regulator
MPNNSKNLYEAFANHISEYVQAHLDQEIVIEDLAAMVGVSKYHLNRLFQGTTGFQLGEFIQRRRLQHAYSLLSAGECSVIDASLAVGYESHSAFSRAFHKAFDCKPNEVKLGTECLWKTPNTLKNISKRDPGLQPEILELPARKCFGLYGKGFKSNSFKSLGESLFSELSERLQTIHYEDYFSSAVGVALESPWQGDQTASRYFAGVLDETLPKSLGLDEYLWAEGTWARFQYTGAYGLMWQMISRIYAGWVIPEGIRLKDDAIVQVYLNNPKNTPESELVTDLYFPLL